VEDRHGDRVTYLEIDGGMKRRRIFSPAVINEKAEVRGDRYLCRCKAVDLEIRSTSAERMENVIIINMFAVSSTLRIRIVDKRSIVIRIITKKMCEINQLYTILEINYTLY